MARSNVNLSAERMVLSSFASYPNKIFDFDGVVLQDTDFSNAASQCIYIVIKEHALQHGKGNPPELDAILLEERVSSRYGDLYSAQKNEFGSIIKSIKETSPPSSPDEYVKIIVAESILRKSKQKLYDIVDGIETMTEPTKIIAKIEKDVFDFTNETINNVDVENIANGYGDYLKTIAEEVKRGNVEVGLSTGMPNWDKAVGGGLRRGTISCIAARAGYGKSLMGANMAIHLANNGHPVLLLDTELDKQLQMNRFAAIDSGVPINAIETGKIFSDKKQLSKIVSTKNKFKEISLDYVSIKGWGIQQQVSLIRRWVSKKVGREPDGRYKHAVVVLDYLKLLGEGDKGNSKEWEVLGYRMTALHDIMSQYGISMVMFAQQNRSGLDRDDESTVSGSDRIIWLCDNFSVLFKVPYNKDSADDNAEEDLEDEYANMGLKVSKCRHGRGTPYRYFIGIYADKEDSRLKEHEVCGIFRDKGLKLIPDV